jgi:PDZ domain
VFIKWLAVGVFAAAGSWSAQAAMAQEDVLIRTEGPVQFDVQPLDWALKNKGDVLLVLAGDESADDEKRSEYWIGIGLEDVPELTKQQLGLEAGLAVGEVMEDSPAAKAGFKKFDILVKSGDTPLKQPTDLIKTVDASQGKELTIKIVRGGKDMTIQVTPVKRSDEITRRDRGRDWLRSASPEVRDEIKKLEDALEKLKDKAGKGGTEFFFARPAIVGPKIDVKLPPIPKDFKGDFPQDLSVQINKQGTEPTKIHVKRGDKEWDVTEEKLSDLPDDIRTHVQKLLGRMLSPGLAAAAKRVVRTTPEGKVEGSLHIAPQPPKPPTGPAAPSPPAYPAIPNAPYRSGVLPSPQAVPATPVPPAPRSSSNRDLDTILRKLEQQSSALERLDKRAEELRKELEELRTKSPGDKK